MTLSQLKKFINYAKKQGRWWVAVGENVLDEPQTMPEIKALREKYPDWEICILHEEQAQDESAEWILLTDAEIEGERNPYRPPGPIESMQQQILSLRENLADTHRILEILREFVKFNDAYEAQKAEIAERELYLQQSEEALMEKAQSLEELRVELEHREERAVRSA